MVRPPSKQTLCKYGMTETDWLILFETQYGKCPCGRVLDKRTCIDHYHVRGWRKMAPQERKRWVRGLAHWGCNYYFLRRGMSEEVALGIAEYLRSFEMRKPR